MARSKHTRKGSSLHPAGSCPRLLKPKPDQIGEGNLLSACVRARADPPLEQDSGLLLRNSMDFASVTNAREHLTLAF